MYRQIQVHPDDQKFQLILWRDDPSKEISTFQLTTVTYGMNSSPYLAIKTLMQLAEDEGDAFPQASHSLRHHTYVDDIITGADSVEAALELQDQLIQLLHRGGFELRKWASNSSALLEKFPSEHLETPSFLQDAQLPQYSILGLHWSPEEDCFCYAFNPPSEKLTKRSVLSFIAKLYDPCGFLSPLIMVAKCFMQLLWTQGLDWDDPLPSDLAHKWHVFTSNTKDHLGQIKIPRAFPLAHSSDIELHGFCDASECGYAAVVYFRCESSDKTVIVKQILSKTRVAPLKKTFTTRYTCTQVRN
ncbi:uncharacterized protein LOC128984109 [Macrosteles quadrilineatus]|uniref:uncharacterized protein LOC128984109 n=2 Tax=Macrosteles quadrilineatus TaxID=74068 RepID=UPI0023E2441A|nr:uncharacterized protein LOC128984109 [Macrosteles quadrilineatus]